MARKKKEAPEEGNQAQTAKIDRESLFPPPSGECRIINGVEFYRRTAQPDEIDRPLWTYEVQLLYIAYCGRQPTKEEMDAAGKIFEPR